MNPESHKDWQQRIARQIAYNKRQLKAQGRALDMIALRIAVLRLRVADKKQ